MVSHRLRISVYGKSRETSRDEYLIWEDGEIRGSLWARSAVNRIAAHNEGEVIGPAPGGWSVSHRDHLKDPRSFLVLVDEVFDLGYNVIQHPEGDFPYPWEPDDTPQFEPSGRPVFH